MANSNCFSSDVFAQDVWVKLAPSGFLGTKGSPSGEVMSFLIGWMKAENGVYIKGSDVCLPSDRTYNPLNLEDTSGHLRTFSSLDEGATAVANQLKKGNYNALGHAIGTNDNVHLGLNADTNGNYQIADNVARGLAYWRSGNTDLTTNKLYIMSVLQLAKASPRVTIGNLVSGSGGDTSGLPGSSNPTGAFDIKRITTGIFGGVLVLIGLMMFVKQLTGVSITGVPGKVGKVLALA